MAGEQRKYSEQEASLILKRASELALAEPGDSRQMSLAELEAAAGEAGIEGALVRRAAAELANAPAPGAPDNVFVGGPTTIVLEAIVDGEIPEAGHEHVVNLVRRRTGEQGTHDVIGRTLTWSSASNPGRQITRNVMVTLAARNGVTTIRIEERLGQLAGALFGGIFGGVGGGGLGIWIGPLIVAGYPALIPVALVAWLGTVYAVVRRIYAGKARARGDDLRALLKALVATVEDCIEMETPALSPGA
ncbi:MAG: hypothetical protein AAF721_42335 [Myxococcota bacterium]